MVVQMIGVGEQTGAMDVMLSKIADFYDDEVDASVDAITSLIEPMMMIVIGGMVGFVLIAMYLPIFGMQTTCRAASRTVEDQQMGKGQTSDWVDLHLAILLRLLIPDII